MTSLQVLWTALLGVGVGLFSGLFGIGGGVLMVPGLVFLLAQEQHVAQATSLAAMVLLGAVGALRYGVEGRAPDVPSSVLLAIGGMVGAYFLGAPLANRLPAKTLQQFFGGVMLLVGLHMMGAYGWLGRLLAHR